MSTRSTEHWYKITPRGVAHLFIQHYSDEVWQFACGAITEDGLPDAAPLSAKRCIHCLHEAEGEKP